jgi:hypothetical protein
MRFTPGDHDLLRAPVAVGHKVDETIQFAVEVQSGQ